MYIYLILSAKEFLTTIDQSQASLRNKFASFFFLGREIDILDQELSYLIKIFIRF